jgi:hypothetical protein
VKSVDWPDPPNGKTPMDFRKIVYQAEIDVAKAAALQGADEVKRDADMDVELFKGFHAAIRDTAKSLATTDQSKAELVQKAAGAVITLYTAILALSFSAALRSLPLRAAIPALFLAAAITMATAYVALIEGNRFLDVDTAKNPRDNAMKQTRALLDWIHYRLHARVSLLHAGIFCLGASLFFLPAPFVVIGDGVTDPSVLPAWPSFPVASTAELDFAKIRYQAEVTEAAARRSAVAGLGGVRPSTFEFAGGRWDTTETLMWSVALLMSVAIAAFVFVFEWVLARRQVVISADGKQTKTTVSRSGGGDGDGLDGKGGGRLRIMTYR